MDTKYEFGKTKQALIQIQERKETICTIGGFDGPLNDCDEFENACPKPLQLPWLVWIHLVDPLLKNN